MRAKSANFYASFGALRPFWLTTPILKFDDVIAMFADLASLCRDYGWDKVLCFCGCECFCGLFRRAVSMAVVSEDVSNLRQGLAVVEKERESDPDNFILFISF